MGVKVRIPTPLQKMTNNQAEIETQGKTIAEIIDGLEKSFPGINLAFMFCR